MAWEIVITGKFITGTTIDDEETAKKMCEEILLNGLYAGKVLNPDGNGVFQWVQVSVGAEQL